MDDRSAGTIASANRLSFKGARKRLQFRIVYMINPSDNPMNHDPIIPAADAENELEAGWRNKTRRASEVAGGAWEHTKDRAVAARERTEFFLRDNPIPTVIGALAIGLAIGLAIRYSSREETVVEAKTPFGDFGGALSLPLLWPFFKSMKRRYDDTSDVVGDTMKRGIDRVRDIDVDDYVKPMRKRWKAWTN